MKKRERTCKKHYLTETYPQVTLRLCKQRSGDSSWYHCLVSTRTQALWPPEYGHSSRGPHVVSVAMLCLRFLDGNAHRAVYSLITRGRESSGKVHMPQWGPHDFRVHFWQMPSPPLPTWQHLQKRPGRPPLVNRSFGRDQREAVVPL